MSRSIIEQLGFDPDDLEWHDLVLCANMDTELFYERYETSTAIANVVDQMCLSCPVLAQCLTKGTENSEWGVWGGIYLASGKPDNNRNAHKSEETWNKIRERISE